jgi:hypothetical protein
MPKTWYVRPEAGEYGAENGTTFATAFDGLDGIRWDSIDPGDVVKFRGYFLNEDLVISKSGTSAKYIYLNGYGATIDGSSAKATLVDANWIRYIEVQGFTLTKSTTENCKFRGGCSGIIARDIISTYSAGNGFQHEGSAAISYVSCVASNNTNRGFNISDTNTISISGCTVNSNGDAGIQNSTDPCTVTINNSTFTGNVGYGIVPSYVSNYSINYCIIENCTRGINISQSANVYVRYCYLFDNALFAIRMASGTSDTSMKCHAYGCVINDRIYNDDGRIYLWYCSMNMTETSTYHCVDNFNQAVADVNYCVFNDIPSGKVGVISRASGGTCNVRNCTFYDDKNGAGSATTGGVLVSKNNIYLNLAAGVQRTSGTATSTNDCYYSNTNNTTGTVTVTASQTTDPLLFDVSLGKFWPTVGSPCIGNGLDLGSVYEYGMVNTTVLPSTVNLASQYDYGSFDIGAYVYTDLGFALDMWMPDTFYLTEGVSVKIYNDNVAYILASQRDTVYFDWSSNIGYEDTAGLVINDPDQGVYSATVVGFDYFGLPHDTATTVFKVIGKSTSSEKLLPVGNSLTNSGWGLQNLVINDSSDVSITSIGTRGTTYKHEGISGWTYAAFLGGSSPFYRGGIIDVGSYVADSLSETVEIVRFSLGINECYTGTATSTIIANAKKLVDSTLSQTSAKVIVCVPSSACNTKYGFIANYGTDANYEPYMLRMRDLQKAIRSNFEGYDPRVYVSYDGFYIDRDNGYPKVSGVHSNGVHPNATGYTQLGKGLMGALNNMLK